MTEQSRKYPIDQPKPQASKPHPDPLPMGTRPSPSTYPEGFEPYADDMKLAGGLGDQIHIDVTRALTDARTQMDTIADAEDAIIISQNELMQAGGSAAGLAYDKGKIRAVPTQYDELARTVAPVLDKAITQMDERIRKLAGHQVQLIEQMNAALQCPETARDPQIRSDIRAHMKALGSHKAKGFATKAAMEGDLQAIHVILNSKSYLMGLDEPTINLVRKTARKVLKPELQRAYEIGEKGQKMMEQAKKGLVKKKEVVASYRLANQKAASDALSKVRYMAKAT